MDIPSELGIDHRYQPELPSGRLSSSSSILELVGELPVIKEAISPELLDYRPAEGSVLCVSNLKIDVRSDQ
jgi:hypothetical protein